MAAILTARSLSREGFAEALGESLETVHRLLLGLQEVDDGLAARVSEYLGSSRGFWMAREAQYRSDVVRIRRRETLAERETWLKQFPVREMAALGWIRNSRSPGEAAEECLRFFGVPDVAAWQVRYSGATAAAAFRMSGAARTDPGAVTAWLRWAELVAGLTPCAPWDREAFRDRLGAVRRMTWKKDPATFLPLLRDLCAEVGVAVVVARTPRGCPASGATRFVSPTKAMMVLSFRYRSDDQFWFTFFHEAGHLLLHGREELFLEGSGETGSDEEREANEFAETMLVPPRSRAEFLALHPGKDAIIRFARKAGVAPGLIVGQLQHKGRVPMDDRLNNLKRRYAWDQIEADRLIP
ncbi:ImmA/IrrE family metallo-endopeptidase [Muricoccus radiodurans]|uniref:ImmA/IrrE family metallo-endopeptidase n=1 Tax=Muricoccus radiodurans TaxID=2231721 RepID=UPI003CE9AEE7